MASINQIPLLQISNELIPYREEKRGDARISHPKFDRSVSVRVPLDVRKKLEDLDVDVSDAVRSYLLSLVETREKLMKLHEVDQQIRLRGLKVGKGTAEVLVREERDREP